MIRLFIGYDQHETVAYHVAAHSLIRHASEPVAIAPLALPQLKSFFNRERTPTQATDFSFSRFLVPYLCDFEGWAIFVDSDVIAVDDIAKLWSLRDEAFAVQVVKHNHQPSETTKFLNQPQTCYPKKNWSSVMLMNCVKCKALTPEYVNTASGLDLHRFNWLASEDLVGELPPRWNHLVDYNEEKPVSDLSIIHYTDGGPWFIPTQNCGYSNLWMDELARMSHATNL
jgi:lipopolysaccharide biosynthesis glycosyltransferase